MYVSDDLLCDCWSTSNMHSFTDTAMLAMTIKLYLRVYEDPKMFQKTRWKYLLLKISSPKVSWIRKRRWCSRWTGIVAETRGPSGVEELQCRSPWSWNTAPRPLRNTAGSPLHKHKREIPVSIHSFPHFVNKQKKSIKLSLSNRLHRPMHSIKIWCLPFNYL